MSTQTMQILAPLLAMIHDNNLDILFCISHKKNLLYCSKSLQDQLDFPVEEIQAQKFRCLEHTIELSSRQGKRYSIHDERYEAKSFLIHVIHELHTEDIFDPSVQEFHGIRTQNQGMLDVFRIIRHVSTNDVNVLIRGETGTGKELVARAIHNESHRKKGPFVAVNCSAISPHLLESALFGHKKGSFTGAMRDHVGLFEQANEGTLFLDEIGDMDINLQSKLLRVLEERRVTPIGAIQSKKINVRILSATHRSLRKQVQDNLFRADLMYRLRVVPIFLPPLRERKEDIIPLFSFFLNEVQKNRPKHIKGFLPLVGHKLSAHSWEGNVRELKNVVEYAYAVCETNILGLEDLPPEFQEKTNLGHTTEKEHIQKALKQNNGNIGQAAIALGMSRPTLWRKRKKYKL